VWQRPTLAEPLERLNSPMRCLMRSRRIEAWTYQNLTLLFSYHSL
jgi:hypothetical protein